MFELYNCIYNLAMMKIIWTWGIWRVLMFYQPRSKISSIILLAPTHVQLVWHTFCMEVQVHLMVFLLLAFYRNLKRCDLALRSRKRYVTLWKKGTLQQLQHKDNGILCWKVFRYALYSWKLLIMNRDHSCIIKS